MQILTEGKEMSTMRLIYLVSVALNICGHMCLYCVVGEILVTKVSIVCTRSALYFSVKQGVGGSCDNVSRSSAKCDRFYYAVYDYEWYILEPVEAKTLILIMIRASKPLYITAGKMFPMTMSMFCNVSYL